METDREVHHDRPLGRDEGSWNRRLYAAGQFGKSLPWVATDLLLAWHLHDQLGLSGATVGLQLLAFHVIGGAATLMLGYGFAVFKPGFVSLLRLQFAGSIAVAVSFLAQFEARSLLLVMIGGFAFRLGYSIQDLPQNVLSSRLPVDAVDVGRYARARIALAFLARLLITGGLSLEAVKEGLSRGVCLMIAVTAVGTGAALLFARDTETTNRKAASIVERIERQSRLWKVVGLVVATAVLLPVASRLVLFRPEVNEWPHLQSQVLGVLCAGAATGAWLLDRCSRWIGNMATTILAVPLVFGSGVILSVQGMTVWFVLPAAFMHGLGLGWFNARMWEEIAGWVRLDAHTLGTHREGLAFAIVLAGVHLCNAAGALLIGLLIEGVEATQITDMLATIVLTGIGASCCAGLLIARPATLAKATCLSKPARSLTTCRRY